MTKAAGPPIAGAQVRVTPSPSCTHQLNWDLHFAKMHTECGDHVVRRSANESEHQTAALSQLLSTRGFVNTSAMEAFALYRKRGSPTVVLVPRTGRVQIRLSLSTPAEERVEQALAMARWLARGLHST